MSNIKLIEIEIEGEVRTIEKAVLSEFSFMKDSVCEKVEISIDDLDEEDTEVSRYYRMRKNNIQLTDYDDEGKPVKVLNQSVMIAFATEDDEVVSLTNAYNKYYDNYYYVFFPTMIKSGKEYLVHAPFVTKSSRDTIARNNEANNILMKNIGILSADSFLALASLKKLNKENIQDIFFSIERDDQIGKSFEEELDKLLEEDKQIIPCDDGEYRDVENTIFTKESAETYKKVVRLFSKEKMSEYFEAGNEPGISTVEKYNEDFYDFIDKRYETCFFSIKNLLGKIEAKEYEKHDSEWFAKFLELLVGTHMWRGYIILGNTDIRKYPLLRLSDGKHVVPNECEKVYLNNGTIDEVVVQSKAAEYIYKEIFKIKEYSVELEEAIEAIKTVQTMEGAFEAHVEEIKKIVLAINNKKMTAEVLKDKKILYVVNQKNGLRELSSPARVVLGTWDNTNNDMYILLRGINTALLDERYTKYFTSADLKKLGCKEGLVPKVANRWEVYEKQEVPTYGVYVHAMPGRANNRQFNPLFQFELMPQIMIGQNKGTASRSISAKDNYGRKLLQDS